MRLSELMKMRSVDAGGSDLGHLMDLRLEERDGDWVVTHVLLGRAGLAERMGFVHGVVERPALIARIMRRVERHTRVARWDDVVLKDDHIEVVGTTTSLGSREEAQ